MAIELNLLIALLKMTKDGSVLIGDVKREVRIASDIIMKVLRQLHVEGAIYLEDDIVKTDATMRMQLAVKALSMGADIESAAQFLQWQEFEEIAGIVLERYGYVVQRNVRFKHALKRMEIDVVGSRNPIVVCVDCKHWKRALSPSSLRRIGEAQSKRTEALAESLPLISLNLVCQKWKRGTFVPVVLSLFPGCSGFHDDVPVVPVLKFQDFVSQLAVNITSVMHFQRRFNHLANAF